MATCRVIISKIIARANDTVAEYQRMRTWFVWPDEDFPRSSTQKPRRNVIRDAVEASFRGQSPMSALSPLAELVTRITGRPAQNLSSGADLESGLGLNSLERVELLGALEDRYQIDLGEIKFAEAATVGDLEKILQQAGGSTLHHRRRLFTIRTGRYAGLRPGCE